MIARIIKECRSQPWWLYPLAVLALVGTGLGVYRLVAGLGPTTNLNDAYPWGIWIGFDLFMVALSGGAFTLSTIVYVFHLYELRPALRLTVLTGLLGYVSVLLILLFDLGRWDRFYHFFLYPNINSALFEVALCISAYTIILITEFSPVVLQWAGKHRLEALVHQLTVPLAIVGTTLSTMHQSSLGTLFVIISERVHPLWYTGLQPLLFFLSSLGAGMATIIGATTMSFWVFRRTLKRSLVAQIGSYVPWALGFYWTVRLGELVATDDFHLLFSSGHYSLLFLGEILLLGVIPIALFSSRRLCMNPTMALFGSLITLAGVFLNRFNVTWLALRPVEGYSYMPSLVEIAIQAGVLATMAVVYTLAARYLPLIEDGEEAATEAEAAGQANKSGRTAKQLKTRVA